VVKTRARLGGVKKDHGKLFFVVVLADWFVETKILYIYEKKKSCQLI